MRDDPNEHKPHCASPAQSFRGLHHDPQHHRHRGCPRAPTKVIFFASVKLQHMLLARPEIATVNDLAGKRIAASGSGNLFLRDSVRNRPLPSRIEDHDCIRH